MKKAWIFIVVTIVFLIIIAGVAKADDYVINEHVEQDSTAYEVARLFAACSVLMFVYAVVYKLSEN